jgi:hypothetical protein
MPDNSDFKWLVGNLKLIPSNLKHHDMKIYEGVKVNLYAFLTTALDGGKWPTLHTSHTAPGKIAPNIHQIGGWETVELVCSQYQWAVFELFMCTERQMERAILIILCRVVNMPKLREKIGKYGLPRGYKNVGI